MAFAKISEQDALARVCEVFRQFGFEGATLSRLATATGLEKASLYHRFPGGKEEIAAAAVRGVIEWFIANVFQPLEGPGPASARVRFVAGRLREFYGDGRKACVLESLSLAGGNEELREMLRGALEAWLSAFADVARESGMSEGRARLAAEQAVMEIEGSLVLVRVSGDGAAFERVLARLPEVLTGEGGAGAAGG